MQSLLANFWHHHCVKASKYGVFLVHIFPYSVLIRENMDQKNSVFEHFTRSGFLEEASLLKFSEKRSFNKKCQNVLVEMLAKKWIVRTKTALRMSWKFTWSTLLQGSNVPFFHNSSLWLIRFFNEKEKITKAKKTKKKTKINKRKENTQLTIFSDQNWWDQINVEP